LHCISRKEWIVGDILLVHWKDEEAEERLAMLRRLGFAARRMAPEGMASLRGLRSDPPAAVIIDLTRLPSHGRAVAVALRQQKATRLVPLVFAGGEPEKVEATRALLPDAVYARWDEMGTL